MPIVSSPFFPENAESILKTEVGKVFSRVLEHTGVYKRNAQGQAAFERFIDSVNREATV